MLDALLVPGLHKVLWSVPALCAQGHDVAFGFTTVRIIFNVDAENQFIMYLNHPMLVDSNNPQLAMPSANFVLAVDQLPDYTNLQDPTEDSSNASTSLPSLESKDASTSSEEDSIMSDYHSGYEDNQSMEISLPDLMKPSDDTSASSGQLQQDLHWAFNDVDEHTRNLNYDEVKAYLCDMHDEPFHQESDDEDLDDIITMSVTSQPDETGSTDKTTPIPSDDPFGNLIQGSNNVIVAQDSPLSLITPHVIPPDEPIQTYPVISRIPERPQRPKRMNLYDVPFDNLENSWNTRERYRFEEEINAYIADLLKYQERFRLPDEPLPYNPDQFPTIQHKGYYPQPSPNEYMLFGNHSSRYDPVEHAEALEYRKTYNKAMEAFQGMGQARLGVCPQARRTRPKGKIPFNSGLTKKSRWGSQIRRTRTNHKPQCNCAGPNHTTSSTNQEAQVNIATTNAQASWAQSHQVNPTGQKR